MARYFRKRNKGCQGCPPKYFLGGNTNNITEDPEIEVDDKGSPTSTDHTGYYDEQQNTGNGFTNASSLIGLGTWAVGQLWDWIDDTDEQLNDLAKRRSANSMEMTNNKFNKRESMSKFAFPFGGTMGMADAEVEGGEVVASPDGSIDSIQGPDHEEGGVDITTREGSYVFSKRIPYAQDGENTITFADVATKLEQKYKALRKKQESGYLDSRLTAQLNKELSDVQRDIRTLAEQQEQLKTEAQMQASPQPVSVGMNDEEAGAMQMMQNEEQLAMGGSVGPEDAEVYNYYINTAIHNGNKAFSKGEFGCGGAVKKPDGGNIPPYPLVNKRRGILSYMGSPAYMSGRSGLNTGVGYSPATRQMSFNRPGLSEHNYNPGPYSPNALAPDADEMKYLSKSKNTNQPIGYDWEDNSYVIRMEKDGPPPWQYRQPAKSPLTLRGYAKGGPINPPAGSAPTYKNGYDPRFSNSIEAFITHPNMPSKRRKAGYKMSDEMLDEYRKLPSDFKPVTFENPEDEYERYKRKMAYKTHPEWFNQEPKTEQWLKEKQLQQRYPEAMPGMNGQYMKKYATGGSTGFEYDPREFYDEENISGTYNNNQWNSGIKYTDITTDNIDTDSTTDKDYSGFNQLHSSPWEQSLRSVAKAAPTIYDSIMSMQPADQLNPGKYMTQQRDLSVNPNYNPEYRRMLSAYRTSAKNARSTSGQLAAANAYTKASSDMSAKIWNQELQRKMAQEQLNAGIEAKNKDVAFKIDSQYNPMSYANKYNHLARASEGVAKLALRGEQTEWAMLRDEQKMRLLDDYWPDVTLDDQGRLVWRNGNGLLSDADIKRIKDRGDIQESKVN